ncbi:hypothetical protein, partial [Corallibacter sp.]|uniref:hypothetical protein n=1 Tax=Corallibacter sp. TaxID=2038084 RepID=UPI003A921DF4
TIPPFYSNLGKHFRHIFDFYNAILAFDQKYIVDLTIKSRNSNAEYDISKACDYLDYVVKRLSALDESIMKKEVFVIDDLGKGKIKMKYTFEALLSQANSHTIHHYAIIAYILNTLGVKIEDDTFGYNPTTPKNKPIFKAEN